MAELEMVGTAKKVLEIGPGSGHLTEALARRACMVTCIEVNGELTSKAAAACERMIVGDVERLDLETQLLQQQFDVILLGDVLEHLQFPATLLRNLKKHLKPSGYLVVSMPNVAHGSVRLSLLYGDFNYTEEGLLDGTHVKFYTLATIVELLRGAGYQIRELRRTRVGIFNTEVKLSIDTVAVSVLRRLLRDSEATTYQFIFSAVAVSETSGQGPAEPTAPSLSDVNWSARNETLRLAKSLMRKGRTLLYDDRGAEARAWLYRSFLLRPRFQSLAYILLAWIRIAGFGSLRARRR